jgi:transitional endoplasmic reticulum ATPase
VFFGDPSHRGRIVAIAATNRPDLVDAALFRPGRFDVKIPLLPPETPAARAEVLAALLRRADGPDPTGLPLARLGERTEGWTQAELERAVVKARGLARLRGLELGAALDEALRTLRPATRDIQRMAALALAECDDASLVSERYRPLVGEPAPPETGAGDVEEPGGRGAGRRARALDL